MDYVFGSVLSSFSGLLLVIISYNIACQWFVNLRKHMADWPSELGGDPGSATLTPAIPKFHEPAHKQEDHQEFSCNLIKGMGSSDCEVPERIWGPNNPLRNSTKTMGPGSRQDVIDDNFGFWNWQKYTGMGMLRPRKTLETCIIDSFGRADPVTKIHSRNQREERSGRGAPRVHGRAA